MKVSGIFLLLVFVLALSMVSSLRKKQSKIDADKVMNDVDEPELDEDGIEILTTEQLQAKADKLKRNLDIKDKPLTAEEKLKLEKEEIELKKKLQIATKAHGKESQQRATALHALGRNLFTQEKYAEVVDTAKEIVRIHEKLDGPESKKTADALGNLASVAFQTGDFITCHYSMRRALYILKQMYEEDSKEILLHRGKMLTFQVPHAKIDPGLSYDDYLYEL